MSVAFHVSIATPHSALDRFELVTTQLDDANEGFATDSLIPRINQRSKRRLDAWASNVAAQMLELAGLGETPAGEPPTTAPGESAG